ncbi:aspartate 1-decarboxylase [Desulfovibrio sp. OttesenSCG-928-A18]|nr:aspartate 1-decarboxylase [Desulfovibrio sp. OttesenSCG-928-A18]
MFKVVRAKLHGIRVTGAELDYHGSITLDPEICREAGIYPLEFVEIWNKNNGERLSTYVIHGKPGSRCCILNGAAARTCQRGDPLIICASEYLQSPRELCALTPRVLTFDSANTVLERLRYAVNDDGSGNFSFSILNEC